MNPEDNKRKFRGISRQIGIIKTELKELRKREMKFLIIGILIGFIFSILLQLLFYFGGKA